ncbi:MAG: nitroreductase family protein [Nanoarchaeota archaeon]|nr:nitroreductase family protein [Nanoarchaeota archaeon]
MQVFDQLLGITQCSSFKDKAVPTDVLFDLIKTATAAPHPADVFPTEFIVVRDPAKKKLLAEQCPKQSWIEHAPCLIAVCTDYTKIKTLYSDRADLYGKQSSAVASYALLLQAQESKLAGCWIRAFNDKAVARIVETKKTPEIILVLGYPKDKQKQKDDLAAVADVASFEKDGVRLSPF